MSETRFKFGENWKSFSEGITQQRLLNAKACLQNLIPEEFDCQGKSFLDIGSGSGLHSVAASQMGFSTIIATDYDETSVATTSMIAEQFGAEIKAVRDDILDSDIDRKFDVVYSWGALHHTGNLALALEKAQSMVLPNGLFIVAVYVKTSHCEAWKKIKKTYCRMPSLVQWLMAVGFHGIRSVRQIANGDLFRNYNRNRGMDRFHDSIDWLGGYPYESASPEEVETLVGPTFTLLFAHHTDSGRGLLGTGCAEYVFKKTS